MSFSRVIPTALLVSLALACSQKASSSSPSNSTPTSNVRRDGGKDSGKSDAGAQKKAPQTKPEIAGVKSKAGNKAPDGATKKGKVDKPKVASTQIPVDDLDVYNFSEDVNGDGKDDKLSWAHVEDGTTYIWGVIPVECDGKKKDTSGGFVLEVLEDGSGTWMLAADKCPANDLYGCGFDENGDETTCGICSWEENHLVCQEIENPGEEEGEDNPDEGEEE